MLEYKFYIVSGKKKKELFNKEIVLKFMTQPGEHTYDNMEFKDEETTTTSCL